MDLFATTTKTVSNSIVDNACLPFPPSTVLYLYHVNPHWAWLYYFRTIYYHYFIAIYPLQGNKITFSKFINMFQLSLFVLILMNATELDKNWDDNPLNPNRYNHSRLLLPLCCC